MNNFDNKYEIYMDILEEGAIKNFGLGVVAALAMMGTSVKGKEADKDTKIVQKVSQNTKEDIVLRMAKQYIGKNEGAKKYIYDDKHPNVKWKKGMKVDGNLTIGVGHLVQKDEIDKYINGISDTVMQELFNKDIQKHLETVKGLFPKFSSYPPYLQTSLLDSVYRGEMKREHKTVKLINQGKWEEASDEYVNRKDYKAAERGINPGVKTRMDRNKARQKHYGKSLKKDK